MPDGDNQRHELATALCRALAAKETDAPQRSKSEYWQRQPDGSLGAQIKTQILFSFVKLNSHNRKVSSNTLKVILDDFINKKKTSSLKIKAGRRAGEPWTVSTLLRWLNDDENGPRPDEDQCKTIIEGLSRYAQSRLKEKFPTGFDFHTEICSTERSGPELIRHIVDCAASTWAPSWSHVQSDIDINLLSDDPLFYGADVKRCSDQIWEELCSNDPHHKIIIGPNYSGKTTVVNRILKRVNSHFVLPNGSSIPILALSLRNLAAWDAAERITKFYRRSAGEPEAGAAAEMFADVRRLATHTPALVILTDVDDLDQHEVTRALRQDRIGELLTAIASGHPLTKILLTATRGDNTGNRRPEIILGSRTPTKLFFLSEPRGQLNALTRIAEQLLESIPVDQMLVEDFDAARHEKIDTDRTAKNSVKHLEASIIDWIVEAQLLPIAGLIASSADGIERDTLTRMLPATNSTVFQRFKDDRNWEWRQRLKPILRVVQAGDEPGPQDVFYINRAIRAPLLQHWVSTGQPAREGGWLIAREAADKARRIRIAMTAYGQRASLGRDLQTITALVASLDPNEERIEPADVVISANEARILPPLDVASSPPPADAVCRYAFDILYKADLEGEESRPAPHLEDARLRQAAIRPFLDEHPWKPDSSWKLDGGKRAPRHRLPLEAQAELLQILAIASTRLMDIDRVIAVAKCARTLPIDASANVNPVHLMRIYRAEVDAALIVGDNPERVRNSTHLRDEKPGLSCIHGQISKVVKSMRKDFSDSPELRTAIGKMAVRQAEVLHLMGRHIDSLRLFRKLEIEERNLSDGPRLKVLPLLGGRGARMYLRLRLDMAQGALFQAADEQWPDGGDWIRYKDKLYLPIPQRARPGNRALVKARMLMAANARRLSKGLGADLIGAKIDAARIDLIQHRFASALRSLDDAIGLAFSPGSSRDVLLELLAVRARALTDAAGFAMASFDLPPARFRDFDEHELQAMISYAKLEASPRPVAAERPAPPRTDGRQVSAWLAERASSAIEELRSLVAATPGSRQLYRIETSYLQVWLQVIGSRRWRQEATEDEQRAMIRKEIANASKRLQRVIDDMEAIDYRMHLKEAMLLMKGLRYFLSANRPTTA